MFRLIRFDPKIRGRIRNEYYWFSGQRLAQYRLGREQEAKKDWRGAYFAGVGAAWHAYDLAQKGQRARARRRARRPADRREFSEIRGLVRALPV
jgi:hypothetical protein